MLRDASPGDSRIGARYGDDEGRVNVRATALRLLRLGVGATALLCATPSPAEDVPSPFRRSVDLIEHAYMYPEGIEPETLLAAAARSLERAVDWLYVDIEGARVTLKHADGREIGVVGVTGWEDLPLALWQMQLIVEQTGIDAGKADLRLTLLAGLTTELDNYSRMLAGDKLESFDTRIKGTLVGIGCTMRRTDEHIVITDLVPSGPAARAGIQVGDVVDRVDGMSTLNLPLKEATRRIRGAAGTAVVLDVLRADKPLRFTLARESIIIDNVAHQVLDGGIGYVRIDNVSQQTVYNLERALDDLSAKGALGQGLVLDLRGNTGGSMKESAAAVDALVRSGVLLTTRGRDGGPVPDLVARMDAHADGDEPDVAMIVLVDERTASGAEIISGSLQELGRAVLVGQRTFGKGQVQKIYTLDDGLSFKMTVAEYQLANDRPVAGVGVQPDVHVGHYTIAPDAMRISGWDLERERVAAAEIVPATHLFAAPGEPPAPVVDVTLELARRALVHTTGNTREALSAALATQAALVKQEEGLRLAAAMVARGLDWTSAPGEGSAPEVRVTLSSEKVPDDPDLFRVRVVLHNDGPTPLYQASVRLACDSYDAWDGLVVPLGLVPSGGIAAGEARVRLSRGVEAREDAITVAVAADRRPVTTLPDAVLRAATSPRPALRVAAHLEQAGAEWVVRLDVTNRSEADIDGLEAWFEAPWEKGIELVDTATRTEHLGAGETAHLALRVRIAQDGPNEVPLELVLDADGFGTLFRPDLRMHVAGTEIVREAPVVEPERHALSARVGRYALGVDISDDGPIGSVVVFANDQKVLWTAGGLGKMRVHPVFDLQPGVNTVIIVATDRDGTRVQKTVRVLGLADEHAPPPKVSEDPASAGVRTGQKG